LSQNPRREKREIVCVCVCVREREREREIERKRNQRNELKRARWWLKTWHVRTRKWPVQTRVCEIANITLWKACPNTKIVCLDTRMNENTLGDPSAGRLDTAADTDFLPSPSKLVFWSVWMHYLETHLWTFSKCFSCTFYLIIHLITLIHIFNT